MDLKQTVAKYTDKLIQPVRKHFESGKAKKLLEQFIFPIVLRTMNVDTRLTPQLYFPQPYTAPDVLATAMSDAIYVDTIGDPALRHVMEREGFVKLPGDRIPEPGQQKPQQPNQRPSQNMQMAYEYINGDGKEHQVTDSIIEGEQIARRN